jgi:ribokinase
MTANAPGVVVLGGLNMDLMVETPRPAGPGETRIGTRFYTTPGGKGGNQAVAAARILGERASVQMVARVGADTYGEEMVASLTSVGVDTKYVRQDSDSYTGIAVIMIDGEGESYVNAVYGANANCGDEQLGDIGEALEGAAVLLVQQEVSADVSIEAMRAARSKGVRVILDPAPTRTNLPDDYFHTCDILTPNQHEAADLCGFAISDEATAARAARAIREQGVATVIVTLGDAGAWVESDGLSKLIPAPNVRATATVGAGDAFNGALAAAFVLEQDLIQAIRMGTVAGAVCATKEGAQDAMPTLAEIEALTPKGSG